jgi:hypothetical protein
MRNIYTLESCTGPLERSLSFFCIGSRIEENKTYQSRKPASQYTMLSPVHESQLQCQRANPETGSKKYKDLICGNKKDKAYIYY